MSDCWILQLNKDEIGGSSGDCLRNSGVESFICGSAHVIVENC